MSGKIELLPCPFCGSQAKLTIYSGSPAVFCDRIKDGCEALMGGEEYEGTENYLVACWNKRAAPVVERQPVDAILLENCEEVTVQDYGRGYFATDDCVAQLYTAPPELAELQAIIARLTAENERIERNRDMWKAQVERQAGELEQAHTEAKEWKDTVKFNDGCWSEERGTMIDNLQAARAEIERLKSESFESLYNDAVDEIERLKGGQGEPVAWLTQCQHSGLVEQSEPDDKSDHPEDWSDSFPVFRHAAEQPAPASVVLPERECEDCFQNDQSEQAIGFNRAIDKVKELNQ
jgi:hypothetical protein